MTKTDKFFFNYGHFSQWARFAYVYPQLEATSAERGALAGQSRTSTPRSRSSTRRASSTSSRASGASASPSTTATSTATPRAWGSSPSTSAPRRPRIRTTTASTTITPVRYFNGDSARALGLEISVIKRTTRWLSGSANLELSRATGTNSDADAGVPAGDLRRGLQADRDDRRSAPVAAALGQALVRERERRLLGVRPRPAASSSAGACRPTGARTCCVSAESGQRYTESTWVNGPAAQGDYLQQDRPDRAAR